MKYKLTFMLAIILTYGLYGCSNDNSGSAKTQPPADKETIFQHQIDALEKAKQLDAVVQQHDQKLRQTLEQQE